MSRSGLLDQSHIWILMLGMACTESQKEWQPLWGYTGIPKVSSRLSLVPNTISQLVLSGDFFQLPPVPDKSHERIQPVSFAFDARSWQTCIGKPTQLTQVFRQKDSGQLYTCIRVSSLRKNHFSIYKYFEWDASRSFTRRPYTTLKVTVTTFKLRRWHTTFRTVGNSFLPNLAS